MKFLLYLVGLLSLLFLTNTQGKDVQVSFNEHIRPILSDNCFHCHGPDPASREAGLRLDNFEGATAKLESKNQAIVPGQPEKSHLLLRVRHPDKDERMPPEKSHKTITKSEIKSLEEWISSGAEYDEHWAFKPVVAPKIPKVAKPKSVVRNPIDAFVETRLASEEKLRPTPTADRQTLIRRATLDLTGLPPTPKEVDAFLTDKSEDDVAFQKVVKRLLASPAYGEHFAWVWLDYARYADSDGYESDPIRNMWPWRDWVVDAFNRNLPYDQFIIEQLAGDLIPGASMNQVLATGFNRNHRLNNEGGVLPEEWLVEYVCDRAETAATVFMGLTWQCARCHDHKYDPITQKDYYQLFAFFHNVPESGNGRGASNAPPMLDVPELTRLDEYQKLLEKLGPMQSQLAVHKKNPAFKKAADKWMTTLGKDEATRKKMGGNFAKTPFEKWDKNTKESAAQWYLNNLYEPAAELREDMWPLERDVTKLRKTGAKVMIMAEMPKPRTTRILERGDYLKPQGEVAADSPGFLPPMAKELPKNRLGFAKWLSSPENPLTSRVIVNRVWERFFGIGLVKTQEDFGSQGETPSHPELLDYLAHFLVSSGWDLKKLQTHILLSETYRRSSVCSPESLRLDPENRLLARASRFRLPAPTIRDSTLAVSGALVAKVGGPPVKPYQPDGLWKEIIKGRVVYKRDTGEKLYRRSLYTLWRRAVKPPLMMLLDSNLRDTCAVNTRRTNTPLQALLLMNDVTFVELARIMADRVIRESFEATDQEKISYAFRLATGRKPDAGELAILTKQLNRDRKHFEKNPDQALALTAHGESKFSDSITPTELAAFTEVTRVILNLDETLTRE